MSATATQWAGRATPRPKVTTGVQSFDELPDRLVVPCFCLAGAADECEVWEILASVPRTDWPSIVAHMVGRRTFDRIMPWVLKIVPRPALAAVIETARLDSLYGRFS